MQSAVFKVSAAASTSAGLQRVVRALHHENPVLPVGLDEDRRHSARHSLDLLHVRGVDSLLAKVFDGRGTEQIAAHTRHHKNFGSAETRRHGLVRALAAESEIELLPEDGFARLRKLIGKSGQVNVGAANHSDARAFSHDRIVSPKREAGRV